MSPSSGGTGRFSQNAGWSGSAGYDGSPQEDATHANIDAGPVPAMDTWNLGAHDSRDVPVVPVADRWWEHERPPGLGLTDAQHGPALPDAWATRFSSSPSPTSTHFGDAWAPASVPGVGQKAVPDTRIGREAVPGGRKWFGGEGLRTILLTG